MINREYFDDALKSLLALPSTLSRDAKILSLYGMMNEIGKMDDFYQKSRFAQELQEDYFDNKKDFEGLVNYFILHESEEGFLTKDRLIRYSYALLKLKRYPKVEQLLKLYYSDPSLIDGPIIVNYLFARKKQGNDVVKQIKNKLLDNKYMQFSDFEQFGAYCVLGDEQNALAKLRKILKKSPRDKYTIEEWPIMEDFIKKEKFIKLLEHTPKHIN